MTDVRSRIVDAVFELVCRYGVKRTSMADVAAQAGVSRQTLYVSFAKKDDLLAEAMAHFGRQLQDAISEEWENSENLEDILDVYLVHAAYKPFKLLQQHPDIVDLINGVGEQTRKVANQLHRDKTKQLAKRLESYRLSLEAKDSDPQSVAQLFVTTTLELKLSAKSNAELRALTRTLKQAVIALIES